MCFAVSVLLVIGDSVFKTQAVCVSFSLVFVPRSRKYTCAKFKDFHTYVKYICTFYIQKIVVLMVE